MCVTTEHSLSNQNKMSFHGFPTEGQTGHSQWRGEAHWHTYTQTEAGGVCTVRWGPRQLTDSWGRYVLFSLMSMNCFLYFFHDAVVGRRILCLCSQIQIIWVTSKQGNELINRKNVLKLLKMWSRCRGNKQDLKTSPDSTHRETSEHFYRLHHQSMIISIVHACSLHAPPPPPPLHHCNQKRERSWWRAAG